MIDKRHIHVENLKLEMELSTNSIEAHSKATDYPEIVETLFNAIWTAVETASKELKDASAKTKCIAEGCK